MIKGLALTPPVLGRISIGKVVEKNGKRLPEKDDQFTLTTQVQGRDGWLLHPYDETLRRTANGKLRKIPVRLMFNDPDLNLRAEYSAFDRNTGRPLCVGNGETCKRHVNDAIETLPCPAPEGCAVGKGLCKPYGRLNVIVGEDDELGSFIFRTTGYNSIRTLAARLRYFQAVSGNRLSCLKLDLKLRAKSTTQSHRAPVYYVDLTVREGMTLEEAIIEATTVAERRLANGVQQEALEAAARLGFANGAFEESSEEMPEILEEFFNETGTVSREGGNVTEGSSSATASKAATTANAANAATPGSSRLKEKLDRQTLQLNPESVCTLRSMAREVFDAADLE